MRTNYCIPMRPFSYLFSNAFAFVFTLYFSLCPFIFANIENSLIETAILLNIDSIKSRNNEYPSTQRRLSSIYQDVNTSMAENIDGITEQDIKDEDKLKISISNILTNYPDDNKTDAVDYAIDYLTKNKNIPFQLSDEDYIDAIESIYSSLIETENPDKLNESLSELSQRSFENLIPETVNRWDESASKWAELLSHALIQSIQDINPENITNFEESDKKVLQETAIKSSISSILRLMKENTEDAKGFYSGIVPVVGGIDNPDMNFGGHAEFKKFDPQKTEIVQSTIKGMSDAIFNKVIADSLNPDNYNDTSYSIKTEFDDFSKLLADSTIDGALDFLSKQEGDNTLFAYEVTRVVANSLSYSAVLASTRYDNKTLNESFEEINLPSYAAEVIAKSVASKSIGYTIDNSLVEKGYDLGLMAQSVSFGSAQGSQLATVDEKSMDYQNAWEIFSRKEIAKKSSSGSAKGAVNIAAENYKESSTEPNETNWQDILDVAQAAALGSLTANTAMSVYFPTEQQGIINYSAQGSAFGSLDNKVKTIIPEEKNPTSEILVDVARASANGATAGATFEIVALLDARPDLNTADRDTIKTIEAATYGSTFGAIQGGVQSSNSLAILIKQATKQGASEGALTGAGLGRGESLENASSAELKSKATILQTITNTNSTASKNASRSIATKSIKTKSSDMLLLMRKFNISPKFTNPTGIFRKSTDTIGSDDIQQTDNAIQYASPI